MMKPSDDNSKLRIPHVLTVPELGLEFKPISRLELANKTFSYHNPISRVIDERVDRHYSTADTGVFLWWVLFNLLCHLRKTQLRPKQ